MSRTPDDIVWTEVHYCISSLVSTLAEGAGAMRYGNSLDSTAAGNLMEQASDLLAPIDDWEEAAIQEGWQVDRGLFVNHGLETSAADASPGDACGWEDLCSEFDIEPYQREMFEHWIVSDWLADHLEALGEKVDKDFAGLTVWARTTTGQCIAMDSVIEAIVAKLNAEA